MDEEDEKADELSRLEAKRASDVNDEIAYNHMLETVDNDAKPQCITISHSPLSHHYHHHHYHHYH